MTVILVRSATDGKRHHVHAELRSQAIDVEMADLTIAICALEHLRAMKRAAGRPRDPSQPGGG